VGCRAEPYHGGFDKVNVMFSGLTIVGSPLVASVHMKWLALVTCLSGQQIGRLRVSQIFFDGGTRRVHAHFVKENHGARGPKVDKIDIGIGVGDLESGLNDT